MKSATVALCMLVAPSAWAQDQPLSAYALRPEQAQPFDPANPPRTHRVGADESLYDIATKYQIPMLALIEQNRLEPPYALSPGRTIELPPPRIHVVAAGQSLRDVAMLYNIDPRSLALLNRMRAPYEVSPGQRLALPALADPRGYAPSTASPAAGADAGVGQLAQAGPIRLLWPLQGEVIARFGAQRGGGRVDGIEIAGREGAQVMAAADGDVVYAGADVAAYGALVLVRHAGNFVTAYGYARRALVAEGAHVRAGQAIAELGQGPQGQARLLFQVRRGRDLLDPGALLPNG